MSPCEAIPDQMLAAEWKVIGEPYHISTVPVPKQLQPYDLLIRVGVASFCHTDMIILDGQMDDEASGKAGGHEPTGTVVALGSKVHGFKLGDRVASVGWYGLCEECEECTSGIEDGIFCQRKGFLGSTLAGGFCEFTRVDSRQSALLPSTLSFASAAPLTCAGVTAYAGIRKAMATVKPGGSIALFGAAGGVGHLGLLLGAKMGGYKIIGVEARDSALEWCRKNGADAVVDARLPLEHFVSEARIASPGQLGFDACVVFSDHDSALPYAVASTRNHGTVVQIGQPQKDLHFFFRHVVLRDVRIIGSMLGTQKDLQELLEFVAKHKLPVHVTTFKGVESLNEVLEIARRGNFLGKLVIVLDQRAQQEDETLQRV